MKHTMAIIGYGGMGKWHHNNINEQIKGLSVKGAFDINPEKNKVIDDMGLYVYSSVDEIMNDKDVDIVLVATPNNFHKEYSIKALNAGKNVICEKPITMDVKELDEIIEVSEKTGKLFSIHQNRRWDRDYLIVKDEIKKGTIGKPFFIESRVQGARGIPGDWRCTKVAGGGMMFDWGVHLIDQLLYLFDCPVTEVYAHVLNVKYEEVDDNFKIILKFENGVSALIEIGTYHFLNLPRWYINGEHGTLLIKDWASGADIIKSKEIKLDWDFGIVYTAAGPTRTMAPRPKETTEEIHIPIAENRIWYEYYNNILDVLDNGAELIVKPAEARRSMLVIEAAFKSSKEGICVKTKI